MSKHFESWIGYRYVRSRSSNSFVSLISAISMLGIAIAVSVLILVLSVVNGGRDTGTQVSDLYTGIFKFDGKLDRVIVTVSDENTVPPRKLPAVYY